MYTFKKDAVVCARDPERSYAKGHSKKEALERLAEYLRNERGYSEKEIKKFVAKSFIEKIDR
jgi:hypothetical protein